MPHGDGYATLMSMGLVAGGISRISGAPPDSISPDAASGTQPPTNTASRLESWPPTTARSHGASATQGVHRP